MSRKTLVKRGASHSTCLWMPPQLVSEGIRLRLDSLHCAFWMTFSKLGESTSFSFTSDISREPYPFMMALKWAYPILEWVVSVPSPFHSFACYCISLI